MVETIYVPEKEFVHYDKYSLPTMRFTDTRLADKGIYNLKFKAYSIVGNGISKTIFPREAEKEAWELLQGISVDMPPNEFQASYARSWIIQKIHYQHWTANANETYEQMVGDECYEGING